MTREDLGRVRIGVLGVGHMGAYHAAILFQNHRSSFIGVYDQNRQRSEEIARKYEIESFSSMEDMAKEVDAVIIASPTSSHYECARYMLEKKIHILVEKPFTDDYEKAVVLSEMAKKNHLVLMVGYVERYNGAVQELSKLVKNPYLWVSRRVGLNNKRVEDSGVCLDLLIHDLDICLRTINSKVCGIKSSGVFAVNEKYEDIASVQIVFENGCLATFLACRVSHQKERVLSIVDKEHNLFLDFSTQDIFVYRGGQSQITTNPKEIRYSSQSTVERLFIHKENALELEIKDFLMCVEKGKIIDNDLDLEALKIVLQVQKAIAQEKNNFGRN